MRIRNVKPEFYRSDDIDALTWQERFLFIALFSYVDDNGVGRDRESDVCADLFAGDFSVDPGETLGRVRQGLLALQKRGLVCRYEVEGKRYLFVTGWDKHQYVKNPNRERYPRPDQALLSVSVDPGEDLGQDSGDATPDLPTVVGSRSCVVGRESSVVGTAAPAAGGPTSEALKAEFDGFWQKYPRKVGKAPAFKAYCAARRKVPIEAISAALHSYVLASQRLDPDKIAHPSTWLNREPWHDDPEALAPAPRPAKSRRQQETDDMFEAAFARAQQRDAAAAQDRRAIA